VNYQYYPMEIENDYEWEYRVVPERVVDEL
jgi:hypothetical protein